MGRQLFANNAVSKLFTVTTAAVNKLVVVDPERFPVIEPGSGDFFYATLYSPKGEELEVIKVVETKFDVFIVERGLDGTEPRTWSTNTPIEMRPTAASMRDLFQYDIFSLKETLTNKIWMDMPVYRKVIDLGALPDSALKFLPHGIEGPVSFLPVPPQVVVPKAGFDLATVVDNISVRADSFNVYVLTHSAHQGLQAFAVLEYIKE